MPLRVRLAGVAGPMFVPPMVMISPGEIGSLRKLAAFTTAVMVGSGTVTVRVTGIVELPVAPDAPATTMLPVYVPAVKLVGLMETLKLLGAVPLVGVTTSQPAGVLVAVAVKLPLVAFETVTATVCAAGVAPPA